MLGFYGLPKLKILSWKQSIPKERPFKNFAFIGFVWSNRRPSPNTILMSQITSALDQFRRQNFFLGLIFQKTWRQTKIWPYQIDTLLSSNKVRNFGEPGPSAKKMVTEFIVLWSNWPPSPKIGLNASAKSVSFPMTEVMWKISYLKKEGKMLQNICTK